MVPTDKNIAAEVRTRATVIWWSTADIDVPETSDEASTMAQTGRGAVWATYGRWGFLVAVVWLVAMLTCGEEPAQPAAAESAVGWLQSHEQCDAARAEPPLLAATDIIEDSAPAVAPLAPAPTLVPVLTPPGAEKWAKPPRRTTKRKRRAR